MHARQRGGGSWSAAGLDALIAGVDHAEDSSSGSPPRGVRTQARNALWA